MKKEESGQMTAPLMSDASASNDIAKITKIPESKRIVPMTTCDYLYSEKNDFRPMRVRVMGFIISKLQPINTRQMAVQMKCPISSLCRPVLALRRSGFIKVAYVGIDRVTQRKVRYYSSSDRANDGFVSFLFGEEDSHEN